MYKIQRSGSPGRFSYLRKKYGKTDIQKMLYLYYQKSATAAPGRLQRFLFTIMTTLSTKQLQRLRDLIATGDHTQFYDWSIWRRHIRPEVLRLDRWECQKCKRAGRYSRGYIVHHVKHLTDAPELAASIWDPETGERQLITVCKACHESEHPEALPLVPAAARAPVTAERWD